MQGLSLRSVPFLVLAISTAAAAFSNRRPPFGPRTPAAAAFRWSNRRAAATAAVPASARSAASLQGWNANARAPAALATAGSSSSSSSSSAEDRSMARRLGRVSGGASASAGGSGTSTAPSFSFAALWGVLGVVALLGNAIRRLLPIALEPFSKHGAGAGAGAFTPALWAQYVGFALFMAYAEGYKGFQIKFSPLVVRRALTLGPKAPLLHKLLAGPYSMGLFHASRKRKAVSWGLAIGVVGLVKLVKGLAYPYRSIVDAGVVVGLSYGALSIAAIYARTLLSGKAPDVDPALPDAKTA